MVNQSEQFDKGLKMNGHGLEGNKLNSEIFEYYEIIKDQNAFENTYDQLISVFHNRIIFNMHMNLSADIVGLTTMQTAVHINTLRLSDVWFSYESLIPFMQAIGCKKKKPIQSPLKSFSSISDALGSPKNYCKDNTPYGKPVYFDYSEIKDAYLEILLERSTENYVEQLKSVIRGTDDRKAISDYLSYLERDATGPQKKFIFSVFNRLLMPTTEITPVAPMAVAYSIRNQYVHNGEIGNSGTEDLYVKNQFINAHFDFVLNYSLIVATELMTRIL